MKTTTGCCLLIVLLCCSCKETAEDVQFYKGADISSLQALEDVGAQFQNIKGKRSDCISILKENGINYLRLRIWNDPVKSFDAGNYCDLAHTLVMAKRIKNAGMGFLLDFHYSDHWADGGQQNPPAAWKDLTAVQIEKALYEYTVHVLNELKKIGAYPDMVQIGNEIGNGMLWDHAAYPHYDVLAHFLNSGIRAVRDTQPQGKKVEIAIHVQDGGSVEKCSWFFSTIEENGVTDYDIIGLSFYPYWHGTFPDLRENISRLSAEFGKDVVVLETAYPYTSDNGDVLDNMIKASDVAFMGLPPSSENQQLVIETLINTVSCVGGKGLFYWEPAWIPRNGVGFEKGAGNNWENQALFYFGGRAIPSIMAFRRKAVCDKKSGIVSVYPCLKVKVFKGETKQQLESQLPQSLSVLYSDGVVKECPVEWSTSDLPPRFDTIREIPLQGRIEGFATSTMISVEYRNYLKNAGFEQGDNDWRISRSSSGGIIRNDNDSTPKSGEWCFHFWQPDAFEISISQELVIDEDGSYIFEVFSQGVFGSALSMELFVQGSERRNQSLDFQNDGWKNWQNPRMRIEGCKKGEKLVCGVRIHGTAKDWGTLDDFAFFRSEE